MLRGLNTFLVCDDTSCGVDAQGSWTKNIFICDLVPERG